MKKKDDSIADTNKPIKNKTLMSKKLTKTEWLLAFMEFDDQKGVDEEFKKPSDKSQGPKPTNLDNHGKHSLVTATEILENPVVDISGKDSNISGD